MHCAMRVFGLPIANYCKSGRLDCGLKEEGLGANFRNTYRFMCTGILLVEDEDEVGVM